MVLNLLLLASCKKPNYFFLSGYHFCAVHNLLNGLCSSFPPSITYMIATVESVSTRSS